MRVADAVLFYSSNVVLLLGQPLALTCKPAS
jgi:hypothetical protein